MLNQSTYLSIVCAQLFQVLDKFGFLVIQHKLFYKSLAFTNDFIIESHISITNIFCFDIKFIFGFYQQNNIITIILMQNHMIKKFTHNRMKACIDRNENQDKENIHFPSDFRAKKLSVELPFKHSQSHDQHQKSIFNQQISVTLNTSTAKANSLDKDLISLDIKTLTHLLCKQKRNSAPLKEILSEEINQVKSFEVKVLINRLLDRLNKERNGSPKSSENQTPNISFSQSLVKPIIEKELIILEENHQMLCKKHELAKMIKDMPLDQKSKILSMMKVVLQTQAHQLKDLQ